jgi:hypothetical protein
VGRSLLVTSLEMAASRASARGTFLIAMFGLSSVLLSASPAVQAVELGPIAGHNFQFCSGY